MACPSTPWSCRASTRSRSGSTSDCSFAGRSAGGRLQQARQGRGVGQRAAVEHPVAGRPHAVPGHGVAADVQVAGDAPVWLAQLQPSQNLTDVGHRTPPSRHGSPPGVDELLRRGCPRLGSMKKESGHAPSGGSIWPPLGGSVWVTLPGSTWATPGGSASPTPVAHYGATADTVQLTRSRKPITTDPSDRPGIDRARFRGGARGLRILAAGSRRCRGQDITDHRDRIVPAPAPTPIAVRTPLLLPPRQALGVRRTAEWGARCQPDRFEGRRLPRSVSRLSRHRLA